MKRVTLFTVVASALMVAASLSNAQSGGGYVVTRSIVAGGSDALAGGGYLLNGTMGQPAVGSVSGGGYALSGGYWSAVAGTIGPTAGDDTCVGGSNVGGSCSTNADCPGGLCGLKSRYVSIMPSLAPARGVGPLSIQVTIVSMPLDPGRVGEAWWVGPSQLIPDAPGAPLNGAQLFCETTPSNAEVWPSGWLHLFGGPIVPGSGFDVRWCDSNGANCTVPVTVATGKWGDIVAPFGGASQPNFGDINAVVSKFTEAVDAPKITRADLAGTGAPGTPNVPNAATNFLDINLDVKAFQSESYPFAVPACP